jgi:hypothetical protein
MKNYFELSVAEKVALAKEKRFVPKHFAKESDSTTTTTSTTITQE